MNTAPRHNEYPDPKDPSKKIYTVNLAQNRASDADKSHVITLNDLEEALKCIDDMKGCGGPTIWEASPEVLQLMNLIRQYTEKNK